MATLSVIGLYNFDNTLFDQMALPTGVDRSKIVNNLLMEAAELEVIYPDPDFMKFAIKSWSEIRVDNWTRIKTALEASYNPIENYNRSEDTTLTRTENLTHGVDITDTAGGEDTQTDKVSAFNSSDFENRNEITVERGSTNSRLGSTTDTGTVTDRNIGTIHGNIGVTTNQQMIEAELLLRKKGTIYNYIIDDFKQHFCLLVY